MSEATIKILVELWPLWLMILTPLWGGWLTLWLAHTKTMARIDRLEVVVALEAEKTRKHLSDIFAIPQRAKRN